MCKDVHCSVILGSGELEAVSVFIAGQVDRYNEVPVYLQYYAIVRSIQLDVDTHVDDSESIGLSEKRKKQMKYSKIPFS